MSGNKDKKPAGTNGSVAAKPNPKTHSKQAESNASEGQATGKAADQKKLSPEAMAKIVELRGKVQTSVGQAVLAMMNLPRYSNQSLGDLQYLIIEPLLRDRLAIASARAKETREGAAAVGETLAGIASGQGFRKTSISRSEIKLKPEHSPFA